MAYNRAGGLAPSRSARAACWPRPLSRPIAVGIGAWGPWIDGGGWLTVAGAGQDHPGAL